MAAAGYAVGTVIQGILNAFFKGGPDLAGPILAPSRVPPKTGLTPAQRKLLQNADDLKERPPPPPPPPPIHPNYGNDHNVK
jgi:hypothetical protein